MSEPAKHRTLVFVDGPNRDLIQTGQEAHFTLLLAGISTDRPDRGVGGKIGVGDWFGMPWATIQDMETKSAILAKAGITPRILIYQLGSADDLYLFRYVGPDEP
jgi:hypothetical protein